MSLNGQKQELSSAFSSYTNPRPRTQPIQSVHGQMLYCAWPHFTLLIMLETGLQIYRCAKWGSKWPYEFPGGMWLGSGLQVLLRKREFPGWDDNFMTSRWLSCIFVFLLKSLRPFPCPQAQLTISPSCFNETTRQWEENHWLDVWENVKQLSLWVRRHQCVAPANFHGVNVSTLAYFSLPMVCWPAHKKFPENLTISSLQPAPGHQHAESTCPRPSNLLAWVYSHLLHCPCSHSMFSTAPAPSWGSCLHGNTLDPPLSSSKTESMQVFPFFLNQQFLPPLNPSHHQTNTPSCLPEENLPMNKCPLPGTTPFSWSPSEPKVLQEHLEPLSLPLPVPFTPLPHGLLWRYFHETEASGGLS